MEVDPPKEAASSTSLETSEDIERIFLRLVVADNDVKLQSFTDRYLCDILDAAGKKPQHITLITEFLTHFNKVVKSNLVIRLPFSRLLELFQAENVVTSNLSLVYLKYSRERLNATEQLEALAVYLRSLSKKPNDINYIYDIFALCIPGLHELAEMEKKVWPKFDFTSTNGEILARCFQTILVFAAASVDEIKKMIEGIPRTQPPQKFPGLSIDEMIQIGKKIFPEELNLVDTKVMILKVLEKELLPNNLAFPLIVVASASRLNEVDDIAQSLLKKLPTEILVDEKSVVSKLMHSYLGSEADAKKPTRLMAIIAPGNQFVKAAVVPYLSKSKIAPTTYMNNIKICVDGCESSSSRVQSSVMHFFILVAEQMPATALKMLAPKLFEKLRDLSRPVSMSTFALCGVYRCMAILGKRHPSLVLNDIDVMKKMFQFLEYESEDDVAGAIVSCLTTWLPLFLEDDKIEERQRLREIVIENLKSEHASSRLAALKYAEALVGDDNMELRWMLVSLSGDRTDSTSNEALRQLEKSLHKPSPPTSVIIGTFWMCLQKDYPQSSEDPEAPRRRYNNVIHETASRYFYAMLESSVMGEAAHLRIVEGDDHWMKVAPQIVEKLHELENLDLLEKAVEIALFATRESTDVHLVRIASCFLASYRTFPRSNERKTTRFDFAIQPCIQKLRDSTRNEFSTALTYLLSALLNENQDLRSEVFEAARNDFIAKEIPGLAFVSSSAVTPVLGAQFVPFMRVSELIKEVFVPFIKNGYHRPTSTLESTLGSLCFILQNNVPALEYEENNETIKQLIKSCEKIAVSRQDSFSQKTRECAARAIGLLSGSFDFEKDELNYETVIGSLERFGEGPPQQELQLVVGEAIVDALLGDHAISKRDFYLLDSNNITLSERLKAPEKLKIINNRVSKFIKETLEKKRLNQNHHFRRAQLVWLLIVVQSFAKWKTDALKDAELVGEVQLAFADGLTENDEFSQDISSKGMGVVYSLADADLKKKLVDSLMTTLTEGKRSETKVDANTKLFEKGQLGSTPTGGKLTTYKELLTLASDLNQPDLVYKFMQLARHNATWNSKMGAAHGFGALLENAKEEIEPYFNQLVPKLYRFRYDPDQKVQGAMKSIWAILTADRKNVVDEFANEISKELLPALTDREYRVRESACLALSDLLRGHDTVEMHAMIPEYLEAVLRVRDDVKESVREAANRAADAVSKLIIRLGSSGNLDKANKFLAIALPAVIEQGILKSTVKANTLFCLKLVLELTKNAGKQLKPYIADLIPLLMDAISENETPLLNYIAVRSTQQQVEALDDARASIARTSPMMTAVHDLLPHIDSQILIDLTPKVAETLRSSVGTSTRSSAAQFVTQLALRAPQLLFDHTPQCDKLFGALIRGIRDRNPSIRKQFANSMSYLAKFVSSNQMKKLITVVVADLLGSDEDLKTSSCHVISNLAANSTEILSGYTSQIVPYVLLEKCREVPKGDEVAREKQEKWNEVWADLVPSTSAAVRLYKDEILTMASDLISNNEVWVVRKQAAVMIAVTFDNLKQDSGTEIIHKSTLCLLRNLNGRIWDGKADVLKALQKTFEAGGDKLKSTFEANEIEEIVKVLQRESSKKNAEYASCGLSTLAAWSAITEDLDSANWITQKIEENVSKLTGTRNDESDHEMDGLSNLEKEIRVSQLVTLNLSALALTLPTFQSAEDAEACLGKIAKYVKSNSIAWKSKQIMFTELVKSFEKWQPRAPVNAQELVENLLDQSDELCAQQKKTVAADALQIVLRMQEKPRLFGIDWNTVTNRVAQGTAGQITGLGNRFEMKMETD